MEKKTKILLGAGAGLAAAVIAAGIVFWPTLRQVASVAESAGLNEEELTAMSEENAQIDTEVRERYNIPEIEVSSDINDALASGTTTLEEAAAMLLEQSGGVLPGLENVTGGGTGSAPAQTGDTAGEPSGGDAAAQQTPEFEVPWPDIQYPDTSASETPEPAQQTQTPATQTPEPAQQTQTPATQAPEPAQQTQTPATQTPEPAQQTQTPAAVTPEPVQQETQPPVPTDPEPSAPSEPAVSEQTEKEQKVQNLIAQAYVLKSSFTSRLDAVMEECISEFLALDEEEQTTSNKIRIVSSRLKTVTAMEKECDEQIASIVSQLRELDSDAADQMEQQYKNEKSVKKAELIARYT